MALLIFIQEVMKILSGNGFGLEENRVSIETVSDIRNASPIGPKGDYHPFIDK